MTNPHHDHSAHLTSEVEGRLAYLALALLSAWEAEELDRGLECLDLIGAERNRLCPACLAIIRAAVSARAEATHG